MNFSLNCYLGIHEEFIVRDLLIANIQDKEIQQELLKKTGTPKKALELAINIEMGIQNQLKYRELRPMQCLVILFRHILTVFKKAGRIQALSPTISNLLKLRIYLVA